MTTSTLQARWVAAAGLTVLASAAIAALTLTAGSTTLVATDALPYSTTADADRVVASYRTAPTPVSISFPAPAAPVADKPAAAPSTAPATASPTASLPRPVAAAARRANPLCEGTGWQARRGAAALAQLRRPADAAAVPVAFRPGRSDVLGMADLQDRRIDVYVRSCAKQSDTLLLHVVAHELGHLVDAIQMTDELRAQWLAARGIPAGTPWFGCSRCKDFATPAGDFAETYAQWQRGATTNRSQLAPAPSTAQLASLARTFFQPL